MMMVGRFNGSNKTKEAKEAWDAQAFKRYRLQDRDKHLLAMLAMCRYLTTEQIRRLCYPGRTQTPAEKRLRQLGGIGKFGFPAPVVERRIHRPWDGALLPVWKLTPRGYLNANALIPTLRVAPPQADVAEAFLDHTLALNNLFVSLAEAPLRKALANRKDAIPRRRLRSATDGLYTNAKNLPFRWIPSESARLPWQEHLTDKGRTRVLVPDAILELPALHRRLFLECEMGTQPIVARNGDKPGSTVSKLERYHQFFCRLKDPSTRTTYYKAQFPDGFAPEVLYLVPSKARADHVNEAVSAWASQSEPGPRQWALTWADASREILTALGQWAPELDAPPSIKVARALDLTAHEVRALVHYYRHSTDTNRACRADALQRNATVPPEPPNRLFVRALLSSLLKKIETR